MSDIQPGSNDSGAALAALEAFQRLTRRLTDDQALTSGLQLIAEGIAAELPADQVGVGVFDREGIAIHLAAVGFSLGPEKIGEVLGPWATTASGPEYASAGETGPLVGVLPTGFLVAIPFQHVEGTVGALVAVRTARGFDEMEVVALAAMTNHAANLLGYQAKLAGERRQRRLAQALRDSTTSMLSSLDLREIIDEVLSGLERVLDFDTAAVLLVEDDALVAMASRGYGDEPSIRGSKIPVSSTDPFTRPLADGKIELVSDWHAISPGGGAVRTADTRSWIGAPLLGKDAPIGLLVVGSRKPHTYREEEASVVGAFANQAAIAIRNARHFQRTQQTLAKTEVLYQAAQSLIASESLAEVLQGVVDGAAKALNADRVLLVTVNVGQRKVIHTVRGGAGRHRLRAVMFEELWEAAAGDSMRQRIPILVQSKPSPSAPDLGLSDPADVGSNMVVPLVYRGKLFGILSAINRISERTFGHRDLDLLSAMGNQAAMAIENARLFDEVQRLAVTDDLTRLANRRGFFESSRKELDRAERSQRPVSALMMDIDRFKKVNDSYGHAVGDQVLRELAVRCKAVVREVDLVGRYGGEEFAFLLPETDLEAAAVIANRLRDRISQTPVATDGGPITVHVSIGIARAKSGESVASLLDRADTAMYVAKQNGGDQVRDAA